MYALELFDSGTADVDRQVQLVEIKLITTQITT